MGLFGPAPLPTGTSALASQRRPLLAPQQLTDQQRQAAFSSGYNAQSQMEQQGDAPSAWDQVSGLVTGLPGGIADLGVQAGQSVAGIPRLASDVVQQAAGRGGGFSDDYGTNLGDYFPLLETFRGSFANTADDLRHPENFKDASDSGTLVPKIVEDLANVSLLAAPLAKGLTAASGAERAAAEGAAEGGAAGAETAAQAPRFAPRFVGPDAVAPETAARPGVLRAARAVQNLARPADAVAGAPARLWTAPLGLLKGVDLPEAIFGKTDEGLPRRFGVKPLLDQTGVTQRIAENPTVAGLTDRLGQWRDQRAQIKDVRENVLLPGTADVHVLTDQLNRELAPARKILGDDPELMDANHLVRTGQTANLQILESLRGQIPDEQFDHLAAQTFGREQAPTERTMQVALEYANGTLEPALRARMDHAWEFEKRALDFVEQMKLDEGNLNPEQLGRAPMESKTGPILGQLQDRAGQLREEVQGSDINGQHLPGLAEQATAARARIPEPDMAQLAGERAQAAARRAGAIGQEAVLAGRQGEQATAGAAQAGERASTAALGTLEGARAALADLQRERYGFSQYEPEWAATQRQAGEQHPGSVPADEVALAQRIARYEGQGRTAPIERQVPRTLAAEQRAEASGQAGVEAQGRVFTGAAQPIMAPEGAGQLPFGSAEDMARVSPMSDTDARSFVRDVRTRVRNDVRAERQRMETSLAGDGAPYRIPRADSGERDVYDAVQAELGGGTRFRNMGLYNGERTVSLFSKNDRGGAGFDALLDRYGAQTDGIVAAQEALVRDIRAIKEMKAVEGSVIRDGLEADQLRRLRTFAADPVEEAALAAGEHPEMAVRAAHAEAVLPEAEHGPSPWTMSRDGFKAELGDAQQSLAAVRDVPFEQWPAEAVQAERRMLELVPDVLVDTKGVTADALYDRIREVARAVGRDVAQEPADWIRAGEVGHAAIGESHQMVRDAYEIDALTRQRAAAEGRPVSQGELIWHDLTADERTMYRAYADAQKATGAQERLGAARQQVAEPIRAEGERAGQRLGEATGQETLLTRQAARAGQRAETLAPRVETATERAQQVAEQEAGRPLRFGERRGKLIRDAQTLERELRTKEGRLRWLEDERIPAETARLAQGPREVAPGAYVPSLVTGERLRTALQQMGDQLAEQTGDWTMGGRFWKEMGDVPQTMAALHARGIYPEYLPGAVDQPTRGAPTLAGASEQLPWQRATPSQHQKAYGHVPEQIRTVQRSLVSEIRGIVENRTAVVMRDQIASQGHAVLDELVQRGELSPLVAESLRQGAYDRTVDLAKEMERHGFTAWDPESSRLPTDRQVTADSYFLPTSIAREFQRWWKPGSKNPLIMGYDLATRGFKHSVLAMSPTWNINNVLGNEFMAVVFGGESPLEIYRRTREVLGASRQAGHFERSLVPEEPGGLFSRAMQAAPGVNRLREWSKDIAAAPALGPPRLYGAGGAAEITRQFAEQREPRTALGRGINLMYRLNETVDNIGRNALYLAKKGRGYSDEEAVAQALHAMGDFNNKTPFERDVVRRIIPFYAWMKHVTQASYHLAAEHPFRTAWLLHISDLFNPDQGNLPDWLRGSIRLGNGWAIPMGGANPLQGNFGSVFTAGNDQPGELMRALNPVIKLGAAGVGVNLQTRRPVSQPPGYGTTDQYGKPVFGLPNEWPVSMAYMAARMIPQGRMFEDLVQQPVLRYDTGQPVKSHGQTIPLQGGKIGQLTNDLRLPFFPTYVDEEAAAQRIAKGRQALAKQRAGYNR